MFFQSDAFFSNYSRTSVMWTSEGRTKSVHNSEVSTLVNLGVTTGQHKTPGKKCPQWWGVHKGEVSMGQGSTVHAKTCHCTNIIIAKQYACHLCCLANDKYLLTWNRWPSDTESLTIMLITKPIITLFVIISNFH